jgi:nickel/cobalt transporter (NicO) family protein
MKDRAMAVLVLIAGLFVAVGVVGAPAASAHPLGNFTINRYSGLELSVGKIEIHYVLDMAEIPTFQETAAIDIDGDGSVGAGESQAWADRTATEIRANLTLAVDGRGVRLDVVSDSMRFRSGQAGLPILYFTATFRGPLSGTSGAIEYADGNFPGRIGWKEITARSDDGVAIQDSSVPAQSVSRELRAYPKDLLSSPLDMAAATLVFHPGPATTRAASPVGETVGGSPVASGGSFAGLVDRRLTPLVLALSLVLAFGFGALHALGPGHGKTITAAYLVGQNARARQAAAVGVAVALMHTASVLGLGLLLFVLARSFPTDRVYPWLTLGTGLVALGLGAGLLIARVRTRRRGLDPWHGPGHHSHGPGHSHHPHDSDAPVARAEPRPLSGRGLAALAVAGGLLPSPTALVVLTGAVAAHRVGYGLGLIFAFSAGLAASLVAVGLLALRARAALRTRLHGRWMGLIPIASAVLILGFGLFFATRGLAQLS